MAEQPEKGGEGDDPLRFVSGAINQGSIILLQLPQAMG